MVTHDSSMSGASSVPDHWVIEKFQVRFVSGSYFSNPRTRRKVFVKVSLSINWIRHQPDYQSSSFVERNCFCSSITFRAVRKIVSVMGIYD